MSGFVKFGTNFYRYFDTRKYTMATGWMTNSKNQKWYFGSDGKMYRGLKRIGSYKYYFDGKTGAAKYGLLHLQRDTPDISVRNITVWQPAG